MMNTGDHERHRPIRLMNVTRLAIVGTTAVLGVLALAQPAWAHVTVHPSTLPAGSSDIELTFRVPNERDNANTVTVQVFFPTNLPLLTVDVLPVPGWTATVHTQNLATPVQTDDGPVSQVVFDVSWTATGRRDRSGTVRGLQRGGWFGAQQTHPTGLQGASDLLIWRDRAVDRGSDRRSTRPGLSCTGSDPHSIQRTDDPARDSDDNGFRR